MPLAALVAKKIAESVKEGKHPLAQSVMGKAVQNPEMFDSLLLNKAIESNFGNRNSSAPLNGTAPQGMPSFQASREFTPAPVSDYGFSPEHTFYAPQKAVGNLAQIARSLDEPELEEDLEEISGVPGGPELLFTLAAEEGGKDSLRKVRLYNREGYKEGGLIDYAEVVREGGRGDDDILLHLSPEEFEALEAMWGKAEVNPITGLPEYGFLSKVFKKVKKAVKKIVKNPIFQAVAPIALNAFFPGAGAALGSFLGASSAAAPLLGNTLIRAGIGAAGGGTKGALRGALSTPGLGGAAGKALGMTGRTADIVGSGLLSGAGSRATGGDFAQGALSGALSEFIFPRAKQEEVLDRNFRRLANRIPGVDLTPSEAITLPEGFGGTFSDIAQQTLEKPDAWGSTNFGFLGDAAPLLLAAGSLASGETPTVAPPPARPSGFDDPLPQYDFNRERHSAPLDYYTYGQTGSPGEYSFFEDARFDNVAPQGGLAQGLEQMPLVDLQNIYQRTQDPNIRAQIEEFFTNKRTQNFAQGGRYYEGAGSGRDDLIDAKLSDGEYVIDAETVALLGDGSNKEGAQRLDELRKRVRRHKGKNLKKGKFSQNAKRPMEYLS